ncbi:hypothetical protein [Nocardioides sp. Root151]|uniref:hypothetical protein n=1 Tax=Nocardioides sp. Root151 TaxID=1736475 RepID=UPI0007033C66|nr:hypothetical protein [Nocardioides sp. Root151]KQZ70678.1 hypothetical protein ASD66_13960 [Nocardioides sp. Root151]
MSETEIRTRPNHRRTALAIVTAALMVAAVVLSVRLAGELRDDPVDVLEVGKTLPLDASPYGTEQTVLLPGSEVTVSVADPTDALDHDLVSYDFDDPRSSRYRDLHAPKGGSLVPVTWRIRAIGGFGRENDPNPIEIRLAAGDQRVTVDSVKLEDPSDTLDALDPQFVVIALRGKLAPDDLRIEVEYDGLTQVVDVASGTIDAGVAQALYEPQRHYDAGCTEVEDDCNVVAAKPGQALLPAGAGFTASYLTLYPYDSDLGWADEGSLWAGVLLQMFGGYAEDRAGNSFYVTRQSGPLFTLDGRRAVHRQRLSGGRSTTSGRVVFRVDVDAAPRELAFRQVFTLAERAGTLSVRARLPLRPVDGN